MFFLNIKLRFKNFRHTGSFRLPSIASNISTASTAAIKIMDAKAKLEAHKAEIGVKHIALDSLESTARYVQDSYDNVDARASDLLASL